MAGIKQKSNSYKEENKMKEEKQKTKKLPWNWGKRKPYTDDVGLKWCNCVVPKLTSNSGGRGQALCLLCMTPYFH